MTHSVETVGQAHVADGCEARVPRQCLIDQHGRDPPARERIVAGPPRRISRQRRSYERGRPAADTTVLSDSAFDDAGDSGIGIAILNLLVAGVVGSIAWMLLRPRRDAAAASVHGNAKRETEW
jgi:hypothetical protein